MRSSRQSASRDHDGGPPGLDVSVAHIARVYDYWLGGIDNFAADRAAGDEAISAYPDMTSSVRANRAFLARSVRFLAAEAGIRQFLDIGIGLPAANSTHQVARTAAAESRVVYVDNDPIVLTHARAMLRGTAGDVTAYVDADIRDTGKILTEAGKLLDFGQPVGVLLVAVLHLVDDHDDPRRLVADLMAAVPAGSFLVISHVPSDMERQAPGVVRAASRLSQLMTQRVHPRSREQVSEFFDGLELMNPGVVPVQHWRPDSDIEAQAPAGMWAGVGRKPEPGGGHLPG